MNYNATRGVADNAGDWLHLQKKNPTLATRDILQHLAHLGVQRVCHLDGVEPRLKQREPPEETALSQGAGQGIGKTSNPEEATYPKDPSFCSHCEEDSGGECWCPSA
jgi:hypothetical protein